LQYLLDNFATVDEVLASLTKAQISGHCQWHFFIADKEGHTAAIEFLNGVAKVHANDEMPVKVLCNRTYDRDMEILHQYKDFGGNTPVDYSDTENDRRFVWASAMLNKYKECSDSEASGRIFEILKKLDLGNNKWSVVYDLTHQRIWFNTYKGRSIRFADFSAFDFSNKTSIMVLDINRNLSGDVSKYFVPFSDGINSRFIQEMFSKINFGFFGNIFLKSSYSLRLAEYTKEFK
jgi:penicillin V acylase-like amidase (Ntn superfamily)